MPDQMFINRFIRGFRMMLRPNGRSFSPEQQENNPGMNNSRRIFSLISVLLMGCFLLDGLFPSSAQFQQEVNVRIEGYTFHTTQMPLQLHTETLITIKNLDEVRHDLGPTCS